MFAVGTQYIRDNATACNSAETRTQKYTKKKLIITYKP